MIIDAHCDVIMKLLEGSASNADDASLDAGASRLRQARVLVQAFAIFVPEPVRNATFDDIVEGVRLFEREIASRPDVVRVRCRNDLLTASREGKTGALLTLEGVGGLQGNPDRIVPLYELGVRWAGLTWNYANWAADGALEERRAGLTIKGRELLRLCEGVGMTVDVSHLNVNGFWEAAALLNKPFIASHSNAAKLCPHPRNLWDDQIQEIIRRDGRIGITFVPPFLVRDGNAGITDIIRHLDHVCALGGERHVMLGSDFDGFAAKIPGLEHAGQYPNLAEQLRRHFPEPTAEAMLWKNAYRFLESSLPE